MPMAPATHAAARTRGAEGTESGGPRAGKRPNSPDVVKHAHPTRSDHHERVGGFRSAEDREPLLVLAEAATHNPGRDLARHLRVH